MVARLLDDTRDVTLPLYDVVIRYAQNDDLAISGIARDEPFDKWRPQAWRMKVLNPEGSKRASDEPADVTVSAAPR